MLALIENGLGALSGDAALSSLLRVGAIVSVATFAYWFANRTVISLRTRITAKLTDPEQARRAETLGRVLRYVISVAIILIAFLLILNQFGISIAPILGAAGVVGIAVGFGAQTLVRDYFNGIFLLLENQIAKGDIVTIVDKTGVVEDVTLRYVQLRDYEGSVHYIPNGLVTTVTNMSRGHAYAVVDIGIAYRENVDKVMEVIKEEAQMLCDDSMLGERILEPFELAGVESLGDSAVIIRGRFRVRPLQQWAIRREFLRRVKLRFDADGIEIPFPHLTVFQGQT
ncbi:MAG: mechanosensitive ion channel family protein [Steroidobacteraceae bacterium]